MTSAERPDEYIGRTLDKRYRVRRLIGRGGMGAVYEGDHIGLNKKVAIKFLLARDDARMVARFKREAQAASKIEHEHVVQIFDVSTDDSGVDYIVMEYVEGPDLKRVLDAGAMPIERALHIGTQLLRGLQAIHDGGILHRDIKPANIVLETHEDDPDFVKIMDFGISKAATGGNAITEAGQMIGTPQYMAPEQLTGEPGDPRSDIYAAALTIYEMIAGAPPFKGGNTAQIIGMHLGAQPKPLDQVQPDVPLHVAMAIDRALDKSPSARFESADEFAAALESGDGLQRKSHGRLDGSTQPLSPAPMSDSAGAATRPSKPVLARDAATRPLSGSRPTAAMPQSADHRDAATAAMRRDLDIPAPAATTAPRRPMWPFAVAGVLVIGAPLVVYFAMRNPAQPVAAAPRDAAIVAIAADAAPTAVDAALATVEVPVDAAVDAGVDAGAPAKRRDPKKQPPVETGNYCWCVLPSSSERLCKATTTPLCRCESGRAPLCEAKPFTACAPPYTMSAASKGQMCEGYMGPSSPLMRGVISCHHCALEPRNVFRGNSGEPCKGFHTVDGSPKAGILGFCQPNPP